MFWNLDPYLERNEIDLNQPDQVITLLSSMIERLKNTRREQTEETKNIIKEVMRRVTPNDVNQAFQWFTIVAGHPSYGCIQYTVFRFKEEGLLQQFNFEQIIQLMTIVSQHPSPRSVGAALKEIRALELFQEQRPEQAICLMATVAKHPNPLVVRHVLVSFAIAGVLPRFSAKQALALRDAAEKHTEFIDQLLEHYMTHRLVDFETGVLDRDEIKQFCHQLMKASQQELVALYIGTKLNKLPMELLLETSKFFYDDSKSGDSVSNEISISLTL